ncbi:MAG TPA: C25 family cysteine peptidase, partial [Acidimicrobiales bacterium]
LRVRGSAVARPAACASLGWPAGPASPPLDLTALPADLDTLVLTNRQRLAHAFGAAPADAAIAGLGRLDGAFGTVAAVVDVDRDPAAGAAYRAWQADPCSVRLANDVVEAVTAVVDRVRRGDPAAGIAPHPRLANVVIAGGDDVVPMARLWDPTRLGNESAYADAFADGTPEHEALATSHLLSDDPYGDVDPIPWVNRELYVPELAVGRLVETPADLAAAVDAYLTTGGRLDPSTAYTAGYDFMLDGANAAGDALRSALTTAGGGLPANVEQPDSASWTSESVLHDLEADRPGVAALYGHFDHRGGLSAAGFDGADEPITAGSLAGALPAGAALAFTMGCHTGMSIPAGNGHDAATADDLAAAVGGAGNVWVAITGYGYGDQATVGLDERLLALFADQLDGAVTVGQALANAKQDYFGTSGLYGVYDEKVLETAVLYGLPMYRVGDGTAPRPAEGLVPAAPPSSTSFAVAGVVLQPSFTPVTGPDGSVHFEAALGDGPVQPAVAAEGRPLQPRVVTEVTNLADAGVPAHGALVTALRTGSEHTGQVAPAGAPALESTADPDPGYGDVAFPARFAMVTTAAQVGTGTDGAAVPYARRQRLVVVPGQYWASTGSATGTQRLFDRVGVEVTYSASDDWAPPQVVDVTTGPGAVRVDVAGTGDAVRVVAMVDVGAADWVAVDLASADGRSWAAALPAGARSLFVQAVDAAGNVGVSSNKGRMFPVGSCPRRAVPRTTGRPARGRGRG